MEKLMLLVKFKKKNNNNKCEQIIFCIKIH